jgi:IclR family transcriptional regulator, acetate operon repressor
MNDTNALPTTTVKSAMRTLDIIEYVVAHRQGVVAQDVAGALAIPASSLSYLLSTLVERDYLRRDGRRYLAGPGLDRLRAPSADLSLEERVTPLVRGLRSELNETCSFMIRAGWDVEALVTEASAQALRYAIDVGSRRPMHCLASGKAILAALPEKELERYFAESERLRFTPFTLTDEALLRAELERIRQEGVAVAREEGYPGVCGIACVAQSGAEVLGAIAVAVPTARYDTAVAERSRALLLRAAQAMSET